MKKFDGKQLVGSFLILILTFFVVISYVNALTSFQPRVISQYARPPITSYPPDADAGPDQDVIIYEVVFFNGSGSKDRDGYIKSYSWSFDDGAHASGVVVTHKYTSEGIFTATLTVTDNFGLTDTDTSVITVSMPTYGEISRLAIDDSVKVIEFLPLENSTEILMNLNNSFAVEIFKELNVSLALNVVDAAIHTNYTSDISAILLGMEKEYTAEVLVGLNTELGDDLIESLMDINATGCAYVVESAVLIDLNSSAIILERLEDELLAELLLKMAGFPSTPLTVATIFEKLSIEKVLAVVKEWVTVGELIKLTEVLGFLKQETLNNVFGLLSVPDRAAVFPLLSTGTISLIRRELLPLPDIGITPITISRLGSRGYNVSMMIHNHGNVETGNFSGEFWIEGDLVDMFEVSDLPADSSIEVSFMWKPTSKGVYALEAFMDPENTIEEIDDTNNVIFTSYGVELPDLHIAFETVPTEFVEGKSYVLEIAVSNQGEEEADDFDLVVEASGIVIEQGRVSWKSFTIGSSEVDKLSAGTSKVFDFSWEPEYSGAYTLTASVDTDERVLEGDRMNNHVSMQIEIEEKMVLWPYLLAAVVILIIGISILFLLRPQSFAFITRYFRFSVVESKSDTLARVRAHFLNVGSFG